MPTCCDCGLTYPKNVFAKSQLKKPPDRRRCLGCAVEKDEHDGQKSEEDGEEEVGPCANCGSDEATLRCSKCQAVFYCSRDCQRQDWKGGHKKVCRPVGSSGSRNDAVSLSPPSQRKPPPMDLTWICNAKIDDAVITEVHEYNEDERDSEYDSDDDESRNVRNVMRQRRSFVQRFATTSEAVQQGTIAALERLIVTETIEHTVMACIIMWEGSCIEPYMQVRMDERMEEARHRATFVLCGLLLPGMKSESPAWRRSRPRIVELCLNVLRKCVDLAHRAPHPGDDDDGSANTTALCMHFDVRSSFLAQVSLDTWNNVLYDSKIELSSEQTDDLIPILRQLAMVNCLDDEWTMFGSWNSVLQELSGRTCPKGIARVDADDTLDRISSELRGACNSLRCKLMATNGNNFMSSLGFDAPQKWRYYMKCSQRGCTNFETKEKPHALRCRKCWYFHWCSEGCKERSCILSDLHSRLCDATPEEKAAKTKAEAEALFGWGDHQKCKKKKDASVKACHGCGMKEKRSAKFVKCSHCDDIWYCSDNCKQWDRAQGGHGA